MISLDRNGRFAYGRCTIPFSRRRNPMRLGHAGRVEVFTKMGYERLKSCVNPSRLSVWLLPHIVRNLAVVGNGGRGSCSQLLFELSIPAHAYRDESKISQAAQRQA